MTKRSARKMVREYADRFNARHDEPGLNASSAQRAFGRVHRALLDNGVALTDTECLDLMAYAHGYVEASTGVDEARPESLAEAVDGREDAHAAGVKAGGG